MKSSYGIILLILAGQIFFLSKAYSKINPQVLSDSIFIGELFPSGNLYLLGWDDSKKEPIKKFPSKINYIKAYEKPILHSGQFNRQIENKNISALEGLGPRYNSKCEIIDKEAEHFRGFYGSMVFLECYPYSPGLYKGKKNKEPVLAFGVDSNIKLEDLYEFPKLTKRPLSNEEKVKIEKHKQASIKDCSTTPRFLDSANQMLSANVQGTDYSIRISTYDTPGCGGHLADIYVLDILKKENFGQIN